MFSIYQLNSNIQYNNTILSLNEWKNSLEISTKGLYEDAIYQLDTKNIYEQIFFEFLIKNDIRE